MKSSEWWAAGSLPPLQVWRRSVAGWALGMQRSWGRARCAVTKEQLGGQHGWAEKARGGGNQDRTTPGLVGSCEGLGSYSAWSRNKLKSPERRMFLQFRKDLHSNCCDEDALSMGRSGAESSVRRLSSNRWWCDSNRDCRRCSGEKWLISKVHVKTRSAGISWWKLVRDEEKTLAWLWVFLVWAAGMLELTQNERRTGWGQRKWGWILETWS